MQPASAQTLESVLRPGDLVQAHAKWEEDCSKCHVRFERAAQDRLCADCHKDVGQDMRERSGFHGRQKAQPCRSCHTDHKGRNARIVEFDKARFDHTQTDFVLRGKHARAECDKCHEPGRKYWQAASDCHACHRKDDVHKGALGTKCADCHTENDWKEKAKFDHDKTRFALKDKHASAKCVDCHKPGADYKEAPRSCIGCHKKDDDGARGHKGLYGERCDSCHGIKGWKPSLFNHDTDTKYALRGRHRAAKCADCHSGPLYRQQLGTTCVDCHKKDDDGPKGHKGSLGRDCAACHTETGWKEKAKFDHAQDAVPVAGQARRREVRRLPQEQQLQGSTERLHRLPQEGRQARGDVGHEVRVVPHRARLEERAAVRPRQDALQAAQRARGDEGAVQGLPRRPQALPRHVDGVRRPATRRTTSTRGSSARAATAATADRDWKVPRFDHAQTRFPLLGKHLPVKCADCHKSARYKEAPRDCFSCHRNDDTHKAKFGTACDSCHTPRAWGLWNFDHGRRTRYVLDGAHTRARLRALPHAAGPGGQGGGRRRHQLRRLPPSRRHARRRFRPGLRAVPRHRQLETDSHASRPA